VNFGFDFPKLSSQFVDPSDDGHPELRRVRRHLRRSALARAPAPFTFTALPVAF